MSATDSWRPSNYMTTTSSTIPGLGAISSRVILSLGKATLRGAEFIITRQRLNTISAEFPHQNTDRIVGLDSMYEDILELSRIRAFTIILVQIGTYQTCKLTEHLVKWPYIEISLFISLLTDILDPLKLYSTHKMGELSTMVQAYKRSLATWEIHSLEPFIVFLQVLAKKGCNSLLCTLSDACNGLSLLCGHPFHVLWPNLPELPFTPATSDRIIHRAEIWKTLENELILWRIRSIKEMVMTWHRLYDQELAVDIVVDLLEFSG
ncbi:hypothetical protein BDZ94DRAFT_1233509 [Collybia nuda]|uniref:Uncharacterized protein n=1 Tax=Collybia nuda TaxID=64659 RepID=A0A9P5YE33_9AGAR|nr:hypothetical protein BDZ94DRAFT_1233509 [Collybia nuda]